MDVAGSKFKRLIEIYGIGKGYPEKSHLPKFCEDFDLNYTQWNTYCRGKQNVGVKIIDILLDIFPNLNLNWFIKDEGDIFTTEEENIMVINETKAEYSKKIEKEDIYEKMNEILLEIKKMSEK